MSPGENYHSIISFLLFESECVRTGMTSHLIPAILWGGILCGTIDGAAAMLFFTVQGVLAIRVWQSVASAVLGQTAFQHGWRSAALGVLLHYVVAFAAATVFCSVISYFPQLLARPVIAGTIYGLLVFVVMNFLVVPLSRRVRRLTTAVGTSVQMLIHVFCVGLPISLEARHFLS